MITIAMMATLGITGIYYYVANRAESPNTSLYFSYKAHPIPERYRITDQLTFDELTRYPTPTDNNNLADLISSTLGS